MSFIPPKPAGRKTWALLGGLFFRDGRSVLDLLPERAYTIQMAATRLVRFALFIVNAPQTFHQVMVEQTVDFPKHKVLVDVLEPLLGYALFNSNGKN